MQSGKTDNLNAAAADDSEGRGSGAPGT